MSMQKGKPIRGKTHYLQEPLRGCRLEYLSNSGPWTEKKKKRKEKKTGDQEESLLLQWLNLWILYQSTQLGNNSAWAGIWKLI